TGAATHVSLSTAVDSVTSANRGASPFRRKAAPATACDRATTGAAGRVRSAASLVTAGATPDVCFDDASETFDPPAAIASVTAAARPIALVAALAAPAAALDP